MDLTHIETFRIRGYETGPGDILPVQYLCAYMEEAAALHAAQLGVGMEDLLDKGLAWALTRMRLELHELPRARLSGARHPDNSIVVRTWPVVVEKLQFRRDFLVCGEGKILARAATDWVLLNLETRRAERIPGFIGRLRPENPEYAMPTEKLRLPGQEESGVLRRFTVRRADIDRNRHVNNRHYLEWILEATPAEIYAELLPRKIEMMFRAEAVYGDSVLARGSLPGEGVCLYGLFREADGLELARAKIFWARSP
ncbi:MAG: acyl-ACP thioesterase [Desulfovibrio sp.]|jgi:acyl-ACP thioesterase|nr:acyl-ACP thioesterase [Desulfovibrio sp.]